MKSNLRFYTYPSCTSCRKAKSFLRQNGIEFEERHLFRDPPTKEELLDIIKRTDNGLDDILSTRSRTFKELDVQIEELTVFQLLEMLSEEPRLLRRPILIDDEKLIIGYNRVAMEDLLA
ncbi:Spx/MgsR family RNA polymerase-binding regulatory protein [Ammoniphilus resinae]|uniref:Regulatory protein spx n=1 Tax=Ammoniphilus resinae TaxID=861532 RepID=A0ABS4GKG5_9BACL|nr:regulatory protein spx [Ammoniphilus resinae]